MSNVTVVDAAALAPAMTPKAGGQAVEVLFAMQGIREHFVRSVEPHVTVSEFAVIAASAGHIEGMLEVFLEDADGPLHGDLLLIEHLSVDFAPLHVARPHAKIAVTVEFNARDKTHEFRPAATIERVIKWAIGPEGFDLEGSPSDYQLKYDGEVLAPDTHVGQLPHPHHAVKLDLVFKVKPQGCDGRA